MREKDSSYRLLKKQILVLNRHIPKSRKNLHELLKEDRPHVVGSDGTRHRFNRDEFKILGDILDDSDLRKLKLPIYIEIKSITSGAKISGKLETRIICHILEKEDCTDPIFIYRGDLKILRKILPTTTQYIFIV